MLVKDWKKTRAQRTAQRRAEHAQRITTRWADHVPPFERKDSTTENQYRSTMEPNSDPR